MRRRVSSAVTVTTTTAPNEADVAFDARRATAYDGSATVCTHNALSSGVGGTFW